MKKLVVISVIVCMFAIIGVGCATKAKGPTDQEMISQRMQEGVAAIKAKKFDTFTGLVSNSFNSSAVGDKKDLLAYLKNADSMGYLDGIEIDLSQAKTVVQGAKATIAPITANGRFGSLTLDFQGAKENGTWVVSGLEPGY